MDNHPPPLSEAFLEIAKLAERLNRPPMNETDGCWEYQINKQWWFAINGHKEPRKCSVSGVEVPPYHAYIQFNGWPAGVVHPYGGVIAAGELANEDAFIEAVKRAPLQ